MDLIETGLKADTDDVGCLQDLKENLPKYKIKDGGGVQGEDWFNYVYYQVEKGNMEDLKEWTELSGSTLSLSTRWSSSLSPCSEAGRQTP